MRVVSKGLNQLGCYTLQKLGRVGRWEKWLQGFLWGVTHQWGIFLSFEVGS